MRALLTGITGNLGYEVALDLYEREIDLIPIVRPGKRESLANYKIGFEEIVEDDLISDDELFFNTSVDCIVHCAGSISFHNTNRANEKITSKLVELAKKIQIPMYLVSTAYIYRLPKASQGFNNAYELDKFHAEQSLVSSGIRYGIFKPSVLVGHSKSGAIRNFSGYYSIVKAFYIASTDSKRKGRKLRFPNIPGKSNLVPVDQAAFYIGNEIQELKLRSLYITNPNPPEASWVLKETLEFFNLGKFIDLIDISFEEFGKLRLTTEEQNLYEFVKHYYPYWSITYDFPPSICKENLIDHDYLFKTLKFLSSSKFLEYG